MLSTQQSGRTQSSEGPILSLTIETTVEDAEMQLYAIQHKLESLEDMVAQYRAAEAECLAFIAREKSYLAPINTIPTEVLIEVFEIVCLSEPHRPNGQVSPFFPGGDGTISEAQALSQVNSTWRSLILQTPSVWSNFNLFLQGRLSKRFAERLMTRLSRSRDYPLTITLEIDDDVPDIHASKILKVLATHAYRWTEVDLVVSERILVPGPFPIACPDLRTFSVTTLHPTYFPDSLPPFFTHAPRLLFFRIDNLKPKVLDFQTLLPWANLRVVEFGTSESGMDNAHFFTILSSCPLLRIFDADGQFHRSPPESKLVHDNLEVLRIASFDASVLAWLSLPNLRFLSLDQVCPDSTPKTAIQDFIRRSPNISHIVFNDSNVAFAHALPEDVPTAIQEADVEIREVSFPLFVARLTPLLEHLLHLRLPQLHSLRFKLDFDGTELLDPLETETLAKEFVAVLMSVEKISGAPQCIVRVNEENADGILLDYLRHFLKATTRSHLSIEFYSGDDHEDYLAPHVRKVLASIY